MSKIVIFFLGFLTGMIIIVTTVLTTDAPHKSVDEVEVIQGKSLEQRINFLETRVDLLEKTR